MQFPKSQAFEISLMEAVKHQPVLYDRDSVGYSNKQDIDRAWDEVLAEVSKKVKDVNVTHCKLRWRSLRDRYVKQFVKTINGAIVEPDLSKWPYNVQLNFLRKHLKKRKFSCEKPPSPKKVHTHSASMFKKAKTSPCQQNTIILESVTKYNESYSDSSNAYEQDIHVEVDSLEDYNCPMESEVAEIEFIPLENINKAATATITSKERQQLNEVDVDDSSPDQNVEHIENVEEQPTNTDNQLANDKHFFANEQSLTIATTTEECINNLMTTVNNLLKEQQRREAEKSKNEEYFKMLDSLLNKLPAWEVDKAKVDILNFVVNKTKALNKRNVY